eukprot:CAMPEP_0115243292 /NCGR_PEP_ID=MMETSP0270-20121206/39397_1 /TAXON_ID=71861 /ORGANISM="Scrippsiella trochoidea, Strain CCMP3099" /LENGTH=416 /DNA_ID=CAMNT_0002658393 /DNA_START=80 /DNA_END=1327 /DNA_ORIENTATION=-
MAGVSISQSNNSNLVAPDPATGLAVEGSRVQESKVAHAYCQRVILLTGATGFLGKVLLERLLWDLPNVKEVRLLLRPGSHPSPAARFQSEVLVSPIFSRLEAHHGGRVAFHDFVQSKIRVFPGDLACDGLGLHSAVYDELASGLDLIIHSAALVSWDERVDRSIQNNTLGSRRMLELARYAKGARLLHISSAFVHGQRRGHCPEVLPGHGACSKSLDVNAEVIAALEFAEKIELESHKPKLSTYFEREARLRGATAKQTSMELKVEVEKLRAAWVHKRVASWGVARARSQGWWDNYTYSKALAESLLAAECGEVPVAILRPSGITGSIQDPEPGWTDAYLLTEPLIEGVGKRRITEFPGAPGCIIDTVPVDLVVSVALVVGKSLLQQHSAGKAPLVYQVATGDTNPLTLGEIERIW